MEKGYNYNMDIYGDKYGSNWKRYLQSYYLWEKTKQICGVTTM